MLDFDETQLDCADEVEGLVRQVFSDNQARCDHVFAVARRVRESANIISERHPALGIDVDEAYRAALLHDIGYAPELNENDFHPLDGANYLRARGFPRLADLILGHSNSPEQAQIRGLFGVSASEDIVAKLITFWDVQIKQGGEQVTYDERISDIVTRYGEESPVTRAHRLSETRIRAILSEISELLS